MKTLVAALTLELSAAQPGVIQLFPAGEFRAEDGRPAECAAWVMTAANAAALTAAAAARRTPYVLDYEHQTLSAATSGQPAPAAGWFKTLEWREGDGLYATDVTWTARAAAMVAADEYRFISPVFQYDQSGQVVQLLNAALTNYPALDGMDAVMLAAASRLAASLTTEEPSVMDEELLSNLRWMLNLPVTATVEDVIAELQKAIGMLQNGQGTAAASIDLVRLAAQLQEKETALAALTAQVESPDPARFVPVEVMHQAVREATERAGNDVAALTQRERECETLITAALGDGRLLPSQQGWAASLGQKDPEALKTYLNTAKPIAALSRSQTGGQPPSGQDRPPSAADDEVDTAICAMMGTDPAQVRTFISGAK